MLSQTGYNDRLGIIPASISPATLDEIKAEAANGELGRLMEVYEKTLTDSRIGGIVGSMKATVAGLPIKVMRGEVTQKSETALADDYRSVFREALMNFDVGMWVKDLVDTYLYGTRVFQLAWEPVEYQRGKVLYLPKQPKPVPGQSLAQEMEQDHPKWGELKILTRKNPQGQFVTDLDSRRIMALTDGTATGRHDVIGSLRRILGWYITKMYAQLWWIEYVESYGQPIRVGRYSPEASKTERAELRSFLRNFGRNKWGLFPEGSQFQVIESQYAGQINTFSDLIKMANMEIAVALQGQTGITQDSAQGSRAKLQVLDDVRIEIVNDIAQIVSRGFTALAHATLLVNYGPNYIKRLRPRVRPIVRKPGSDAEKVTTFTGLSALGVAVPIEEIHDQLGVPQPEQDQLVLYKGKVVPMPASYDDLEVYNETGDDNGTGVNQDSGDSEGTVSEGDASEGDETSGADDGTSDS